MYNFAKKKNGDHMYFRNSRDRTLYVYICSIIHIVKQWIFTYSLFFLHKIAHLIFLIFFGGGTCIFALSKRNVLYYCIIREITSKNMNSTLMLFISKCYRTFFVNSCMFTDKLPIKSTEIWHPLNIHGF